MSLAWYWVVALVVWALVSISTWRRCRRIIRQCTHLIGACEVLMRQLNHLVGPTDRKVSR